MRIFELNPDYYLCNRCKSVIRKEESPIDYNADWFDEKYIEGLVKILDSDRIHYDNMFNQKYFKPALEMKFDTVHSFGGGMPKLESYLHCNKIAVYDINASKYEQYKDKFAEKFNVDTNKLQFNDCDVNPEFVSGIKTGSGDLFCFVHILEHVPQDYIMKLFDSLKLCPAGILIYQPNIQTAKDAEWCHFHKEHITFARLKWFVKRIKKQLKQKVLIARRHSDDFLLLSKKREKFWQKIEV
ncbi:MAG: hypothetical protein QG635_1756 [Bacteroidota bacterium]|nr:hypothetical protein [Bacteroidota bacterium]